jgi:16S rRNA (guanine1516-N2)-methyltransferase
VQGEIMSNLFASGILPLPNSLPENFALIAHNQELAATMVDLGQRLGVTVRVEPEPACDAICLVRTTHRLELRQGGPKAPGPVYVDFVAGKAAHRRQFGGGKKQPLARAVGLNKGFTPTVLDATAGLGRDSFVLATLGCEVRLLERSPIIAALLEDGLRRAQADDEVAAIASRMQVVNADAIRYLQTLITEDRPEVIYLDPMYPHRDKSALVKKEMRVFREIVGDDPDTAELLTAAIDCATARVVVKRPAKAEFLGGIEPHSSVQSPNTRYDLYIRRGLGA